MADAETKDESASQPLTEMIAGLVQFLRIEGSNVAKRFPRWAQPLVFAAVALSMTIFLIVAMPFFVLFRGRRLQREGRTLKEIMRRAERLWVEDSPAAASAHLRAVLVPIRAAKNGKSLSDLSVRVEPYGEVFFATAWGELLQLLYRFEATQDNWDGALEVIEEMIDIMSKESAGPLLLSKAHCLLKLERDAEARELLFQIRNPSNPEDEAGKLLAEISRPHGSVGTTGKRPKQPSSEGKPEE